MQASVPIESRDWWLTTLIFSITYLGLAIGKVPKLRVDRPMIAFIGATAMLCFGLLTLQQATSQDSIDYETLFLLFGMMVVVGFLRFSGFFTRLAHWSLDRIRSPKTLLAVVILLSGLLSAFLVNDIICLALTPLVLHLTERLSYKPTPHLIALATAANIGSAATITGNPQNMFIGAHSHISYLHFFIHLMPVAMIGLAIDYIVVAMIYRRDLARDGHAWGHIHKDRMSNRRPQIRLQIKSVIIALITVILFFTGLPISIIAIGAAAVLMLDRVKPLRIYREIDWSLLLMFVGLFIVVHAFQLHVVSHWGVEHWDFLLAHPVTILSGVSAGLSNLVSNVPAVLLFEPILKAMAPEHRETAWMALAMSSTLAGNLTILGSVANLIVVENARREGVEISFWQYSKVGIPITLATLGVGVAWLKFVQY